MGAKYTQAQKAASDRYQHERVEDIRIRVPKGEKVKIKAFAESQGESLNAFVVRAIREAMGSDNM